MRTRLTLLLAVLASLPGPGLATPAPVPPPTPDGPALPTPPAPGKSTPEAVVDITFAYGSEKKGWIEEVTRSFNDSSPRLAGGERVRVVTQAEGSGKIVEGLLTGTLRAHVVSPASRAFLIDANGQAAERGQGAVVALDGARELVRSPIVLATWSDLADSIGWRERAPGWREVFDSARDPKKWAELNAGRADVGPFRLAYTRPDDSNSGLHALFLVAYAANNRFDAPPTRGELNSAAFRDYLRGVEASVPRPLPGSTGFLATLMLKEGPSKVTAAILYESLVIEANRSGPARDGSPRLVAIYPAEGTFQTEHPVGVVDREWVTPKHREASEKYIAYLLDRPQQEKAKVHGFRPADPSLPVDDLLRPDYGVAPGTPTTLPTPSSPVIATLRKIWDEQSAAPGATPLR